MGLLKYIELGRIYGEGKGVSREERIGSLNEWAKCKYKKEIQTAYSQCCNTNIPIEV